MHPRRIDRHMRPSRPRHRWWPVGLYRVAGESMQPTYRPGDTLVGWHWFRPRPGQVVVVMRDGRPLIKRVIRLAGDAIWLEGDNPGASTDSRHFGTLDRQNLRARIILRLG